MIRLVLENLILFLLPMVLFVVYTMIRRSKERDNTISRALDSAPLPLLFTVGFVLMVSVLAYFGTKSDSGKPGQKYRPPEMVNGEIKPGTFE